MGKHEIIKAFLRLNVCGGSVSYVLAWLRDLPDLDPFPFGKLQWPKILIF